MTTPNTAYHYRVAGHAFRLCTSADDEREGLLAQYEPFAVGPTDDVVFELTVSGQPPEGDFAEEYRQDDDGTMIVAGSRNGQPCFQFLLHGRHVGWLTAACDYRHATLCINDERQYTLNNALMVMFALSTSTRRTVLFHSSVVVSEGRGYMFLGKSGTGKSTHSRLWLRYIEGTRLLNDDNPVVRIGDDGTPRVYGSPWSGKTPCYVNDSAPIGAIVQLSQAPHNAIRRLRPLEAYGALLSSISGKRWDAAVAEGLHATEEALVRSLSVYHLECLPDEGAARLCQQTVSHGE